MPWAVVAWCVLVVVGNTTKGAGADPDRPVSYRLDVAPLLSKAGCNMGACHGNGQGKGGFRLSLRGDDPAADWLAITRETHARRVNIARPEASLLLLKPTGQVAHEGGQRFRSDSEAFDLLRGWIAQGALDDHAKAPKVERIVVSPGEQALDAIGSGPARYEQQLRVVAEFSDGSTRDVTRQASYDLSDPSRAEITEDGLVRAARAGDVAVSARYAGARATARLLFLPQRADFVWQAPASSNIIDEHVFSRLRLMRVKPSPVCSDEVFARRVYLDTIGVLPSADEARAFLESSDPDKRARLIDALLRRPEFNDFWALKWADVLRNEQKVMGPKGVWIFQRWLRNQIERDTPMDEFARALLASRGSTWANPPASFYRTNRDPEACAETVGQVFLGVRLQCARCHNHPFDDWTQDDYYGLASSFANIARKQINNNRRDTFDKHENNGDEVIYLKGRAQMVQPRSGAMMQPKPLRAPALEVSSEDGSALDALAEAITSDRQFARVMANRVWFHLMGQGIVEPVDDFRESNPPADPALLEAITDQFVRGGMQLRPLIRLVLNSQTYQLSSIPNETNADDLAPLARARVRLLSAEVLRDSIYQALSAPLPNQGAFPDARTTQVAGVPTNDSFLKAFGKPDRLLACECERSDSTTLAQALQLINGRDVHEAVESSENRLSRFVADPEKRGEHLDELYLACLARFPTESERAALVGHLSTGADTRAAWEDIAWAILNSKEFLLRH